MWNWLSNVSTKSSNLKALLLCKNTCFKFEKCCSIFPWVKLLRSTDLNWKCENCLCLVWYCLQAIVYESFATSALLMRRHDKSPNISCEVVLMRLTITQAQCHGGHSGAVPLQITACAFQTRNFPPQARIEPQRK